MSDHLKPIYDEEIYEADEEDHEKGSETFSINRFQASPNQKDDDDSYDSEDAQSEGDNQGRANLQHGGVSYKEGLGVANTQSSNPNNQQMLSGRIIEPGGTSQL